MARTFTFGSKGLDTVAVDGKILNTSNGVADITGDTVTMHEAPAAPTADVTPTNAPIPGTDF